MKFMIEIDVAGPVQLHTGTTRADHVRQEIWDAVDDVRAWDGEDEYLVTVKSITP
jgi:hypothetical protein